MAKRRRELLTHPNPWWSDSCQTNRCVLAVDTGHGCAADIVREDAGARGVQVAVAVSRSHVAHPTPWSLQDTVHTATQLILLPCSRCRRRRRCRRCRGATQPHPHPHGADGVAGRRRAESQPAAPCATRRRCCRRRRRRRGGRRQQVLAAVEGSRESPPLRAREDGLAHSDRHSTIQSRCFFRVWRFH